MADQQWNWQLTDWPHFTFNADTIAPLEQEFIRLSGALSGSLKHVDEQDQQQLRIELLSDEAFKTSEIEGELLDRDSLQSSIRRNLGLDGGQTSARPSEAGIAELMVDLVTNYSQPLSHEQLFRWHALVCNGRQDLEVIGGYREHADPMQVVSNRLDIDRPKVHFEAPPSDRVAFEMQRFIEWFNTDASGPANGLLPLARSGIAHFYFLCIHPFEDGNGRIARALSEQALSQGAGHPTLTRLARTIEQHRQDYYGQLAAHNQTLELTGWLNYFAQTVLTAQRATLDLVDFIIGKARFFDLYDGNLNERQRKVLLRMFAAGPDGFTGGLSAGNYVSITRTSTATATRDLQRLVNLGALNKTGELKSTRYWLAV